MNASLAVPSDSNENLHLTQELQPHQNVCSPEREGKLWLGISDSQEEGVWRNVVTNNPVDYLNFAPTYPHGSTFYGCALLTVTGFWHDTTCLYIRNCAGCMVNRSSYLYLRGFCFDTEHQNRFRLSGYTDERVHFLGFYNLLIAWEAANKMWVFYNILENSTYMHLNNLAADGYPLGKHEWITNSEICGVPKGNDMSLSLSPCNKNQYMCRSGQCITLLQRCDLNNDCIDRSDEFNCGKVVISNEYQRELPPVNVRGNVLKLSPELRLLRVANVDDISMAIDVELQVILQWVDDRLSFKHLTASRSGSILTEEEVHLIWTPRYQLINLEGGKMELLEESVIITTANNATVSHFNDINMDPIYPGDSNNLSIISHYTARFTCLFRFFAYPFDIQLCTIELHLPSIYEGKVEFSEDDAAVNYSGVMDLALYTIRDVSIGSNSGANQVIMEFKLHRRPGVIMLSTFLPSSLLLLVSWSTLFIKLDALNVRAIMSLTTLLVLYTLFSNLSSSLPATAEIKLIDIWFFFIISILFVNIMMNVFVRDDVQISVPGPQKVIRVQPVPYKAPASVSYKIYVSVRFLTIYKTVIIPVMIIVFNISFWVTVFL
ncbi:uncharacterized protein [Panulirus ornatus]|uniref:uncharacterized protein n=1 Tax=Panulirus ornatus TaxID=150431 RepID=UPI003A86E448